VMNCGFVFESGVVFLPICAMAENRPVDEVEPRILPLTLGSSGPGAAWCCAVQQLCVARPVSILEAGVELRGAGAENQPAAAVERMGGGPCNGVVARGR